MHSDSGKFFEHWARFSPHLIALLSMLVFPASLCAQDVKSGNLDELLHAFVDAAFAEPRAAPFDFDLEEPQVSMRLRIVALFSDPMEVGAFTNRCAASSQRRRIVCDLRFLNSIVADTLVFSAPIELVYGSDRDKLLFRNGPYMPMLRWVLAHEIGHIALGHTASSYSDGLHNTSVFDNLQQRKELEADEFAVRLIGGLDSIETTQDYSFALDVVNALIRRNLCPETYPASCDRIAPGAGLIFNSANQEPIFIKQGAEHPELVARFVRILYISGIGTPINSINYLAKQIIDTKFRVEDSIGNAQFVSDVLPH